MAGSIRIGLIFKYIYGLWIKLGLVLAWINTRLILIILFYLLFTPMGIVMRMFGADLLDRKIEKGRDTYWRKKETRGFNPLDYERQF